MVDLGSLAGGPLGNVAVSLTLVDMQHPDQPLIYVNRMFTNVTGYTLEETVGKNCRFLQGPDTDPAATRKISDAIKRKKKITVDLLNYRKDGTAFNNRLKLYPLVDDQDRLVAYCGVQIDLGRTDAGAKETEAERLGDMLVGKSH